MNNRLIVEPWFLGYARDDGVSFSRAAWAITSIASGWRERTLRESAPQSSHAR